MSPDAMGCAHSLAYIHFSSRALALSNLLGCCWVNLQALESEYIIDWLGELARAVAAARI